MARRSVRKVFQEWREVERLATEAKTAAKLERLLEYQLCVFAVGDRVRLRPLRSPVYGQLLFRNMVGEVTSVRQEIGLVTVRWLNGTSLVYRVYVHGRLIHAERSK